MPSLYGQSLRFHVTLESRAQFIPKFPFFPAYTFTASPQNEVEQEMLAVNVDTEEVAPFHAPRASKSRREEIILAPSNQVVVLECAVRSVSFMSAS